MLHPSRSDFIDASFSNGATVGNAERSKPEGPAWARLLSRLFSIARWPWRVAAIRRDMALMASMSNRDLSDIGLVRQDIEDAISLPIGTPPTDLFAARVAERRMARERTMRRRRSTSRATP